MKNLWVIGCVPVPGHMRETQCQEMNYCDKLFFFRLLEYISAGSGPDHFLTKEAVAELSKKAIEKGITYQAALRMAALDKERQQYWEQKAAEAEKNKRHTPIIRPNVLKDVCKEKGEYQYEE